MGDLLTEPHDGHGAGDTCPACPHAPAVPDSTVEALSEWFEENLTHDHFRDWPNEQFAAALAPLLTARAAAPDALRVRIEALESALRRTEANFIAAVNGRPVRDMAENLAENRAALLEDGAQ